MSWTETSRQMIARVHAQLSDDATLKERIKAVDAAYPFGERAYWPYKGWLKARREYLRRFGWKPRGHKEPPGLFDGWARDPVTGRPIIP
jgi:hypothetical protein